MQVWKLNPDFQFNKGTLKEWPGHYQYRSAHCRKYFTAVNIGGNACLMFPFSCHILSSSNVFGNRQAVKMVG